MSDRTTWRPKFLTAVAVLLASAATAAGQAEVYIGTSQTPMPELPDAIPEPRQPVLFVHGHNALEPDDADFNYRKNFHEDPAGSLTSFQATLDSAANAWLEIEPYYVRFQEQRRSIVEDAREIADAVERILHRHDPSHVPGMANPTTTVRVAIIGYSKGTISSRLYLKSLHEQVLDLPPPRPGFNPISELVAISPPNHGLNTSIVLPDNVAARQLNNGYRADCNPLFLAGSDVLDFIEELNGHPIEDTLAEPFANPALHHLEAPGSRPNGAPLSAGTLYACLYADGGRDFVGGGAPSSDCQGRVLAANLAPDAVNREVASIPGAGDAVLVHQNAVHTPEVICRALATVVHHRAPAEDFACALDAGGAPRVPPRTAVVLVLDFSGSMLAAASPGGAQRLTVLKQAVEIFCQLYAAFAGPGDRLGAVFFGTQATAFSVAGAALVPLTDVNLDAIVQDLNDRQTAPGELTAMGSGLSSAIGELADPAAAGAATKHIVLFTDGMQNVPPMVSTPPPPLVIATTPPTGLDTALGISIHTIGVGASSPFVAQLSAIAAETGGTQKITIAADEDLREFFVQTLIEALKGNSPKLVDYRKGTFSGASVEERFTVGPGAKRLVLELSWHGRAALRFGVEKDGADVTASGRFVEGPFYRLFVIDLAENNAASTVTSAGTWAMRIAGDGKVPYEVAAMVDEPRLEVDATLVRRAVRAGEPIELRVALRLDGHPLASPAAVRAVVSKPKASAGNLLAESATPAEPPGFTLEGADPAQRKLALLLADDANWQRLGSTVSAIELRPEPGGVYAGAFASTDVPGLYRADFEIEGDGPATGPFRRRLTQIALVRLGPVNPGDSGIRAREVASSAGERTLELSLRPRDLFGNFLGPGWGSLIALTLDGKRLDAALRDELDGTYVVPLTIAAGSDPTITIAIDGESVYAGSVSGVESPELGRTQWWKISLLALLALLVVIIVWRIVRSR
jgi:hypothetical protein